MNTNKDHNTNEYNHLISVAQAIWPSYFSLASMTFAWNASLFAAFGILITNGVDSGSNLHLYYFPAAVLVAMIGIVYNLGAHTAYRYMNNRMEDIRDGLIKVQPNEEVIIPSLFAKLFGDKKASKWLLKDMTKVFFWLLVLAWIMLGAFAIYYWNVKIQ